MDKEKELRHNISELQKKLNDLRREANHFNKANQRRLFEKKCYEELISKLKKEGRITNEELKMFLKRKKEADKIIKEGVIR